MPRKRKFQATRSLKVSRKCTLALAKLSARSLEARNRALHALTAIRHGASLADAAKAEGVSQRTIRKSTMTGEPRWVLLSQPKEKGLAALICGCDERLDRITCFYVVPNLGDLIEGCKIIGECHPLLRSGRRLQSLSEFYWVAKEIIANRKPENDITVKGDVVFNEQTLTVTVGGCEVFLPGNAAVIFKLLVNNAGVVVSRGTLAEAILTGSQQKPKSSRHLDKHLTNHIYMLRKKLRQFGSRIVRVKGVGYTYKEDVNVTSRDQIGAQRMANVVIRQSDFRRLHEDSLPRASSSRR